MCNCEGPNAGEFADLVLTEEEKKEIAKVREIATGFPIDPKYISCKSIVSKDFQEIRVIFLHLGPNSKRNYKNKKGFSRGKK